MFYGLITLKEETYECILTKIVNSIVSGIKFGAFFHLSNVLYIFVKIHYFTDFPFSPVQSFKSQTIFGARIKIFVVFFL